MQSEFIVSSLCKVNRLVSSLQKVKMFFFCSANLRDYLFILKSKQIGFFTTECEDILFCVDWFFSVESEDFFFRSAKLTDYFFSLQSEQKVNMFFFRSEKLTDYFFSLHSEQKVNRK